MGRRSWNLLYGIDFSGSRDCGRKIWITCLRPNGTGAGAEQVLRASDLPGSGVERERALAAVRSWIAAERNGLIGIDAPLAVPAALRPPGRWRDWLLRFNGLYPEAASFREAMVRAAGGRELLRATEREARAPFSSYNLRLYRQTYYLLSRVIAPLVRGNAVSVLPMLDPSTDCGCVIEVCPASTLRRLGWYPKSYKSAGAEARLQRRWILARAITRYRLAIGAKEKASMIEDQEGDALDSLLAACTVLEAIRSGLSRTDCPASALERREGRVYLPSA